MPYPWIAVIELIWNGLRVSLAEPFLLVVAASALTNGLEHKQHILVPLSNFLSQSLSRQATLHSMKVDLYYNRFKGGPDTTYIVTYVSGYLSTYKFA